MFIFNAAVLVDPCDKKSFIIVLNEKSHLFKVYETATTTDS